MGLSPRLKFVIGGTLTILFRDNPVTAFFRRSRKLCHSLGRPSRSDFVQFEVEYELLCVILNILKKIGDVHSERIKSERI